MRAGEVLHIPSNLPHKAEALEDTVDLDVFTPIRQDWLDGTDSYYCLGVTEAKMYEKQFMEAMPDLKAYIVVGSGHEEESKTVEF